MKTALIIGSLLVLLVVLVMVTRRNGGSGGSWTVYGTDGCGWTRKQLKEMDKKGIAYTYVNCEHEHGMCLGMTGFPTLKDENGVITTGYKEF